MLIERSLNVTFVLFDGLAGVQSKSAIGARHVPPDGLALGALLGLLDGDDDGLSEGELDGLSDGESEGDGLSDGEGVGDGLALAGGGGGGGSSRGTDVAVDERSIVWPPTKTDSSGVTRLNWPVTVIATVWSIAATQFALTSPAVTMAVPSQVIAIRLAGTDRAELRVSFWIAQVIRFVVGP
jgi:hypothetical protein